MNPYAKKSLIAIGVYLCILLFITLVSMRSSIEVMPEDCAIDSQNCAHIELELNVSNEELHQAMEEWQSSRIFTSSFEEGHIVDRTLFMQFPDDILYENNCGTIEIHSQSRLGKSDFGVNKERIDLIEEFLEDYDWQTTCQ